VIKGFKEFILRGNVIDLAVAVVIGAAFNEIVQQISGGLIQPVIAALGGSDATGLSTTLVAGNPDSVIHWDTIITALINFLIIAAIVYFLFVLPMNTYRERRDAKLGTKADEPSEDIALLREIRDLLGTSGTTPR
jgi:large conductance mechanosensitive channel